MNEFINTQLFSAKIEDIVRSGKDVSYMDAIIHYCDVNSIEIETGAKLINTIIKKKIQAEASNLNFLKEKYAKLPL
jgi:hypothetical protein